MHYNLLTQNDESEYHLMSNSDTGFITYKSTLRAYDKHNASFTTLETKIHLMNVNKELKSPKNKRKKENNWKWNMKPNVNKQVP